LDVATVAAVQPLSLRLTGTDAALDPPTLDVARQAFEAVRLG
jgi:hypothetical protein